MESGTLTFAGSVSINTALATFPLPKLAVCQILNQRAHDRAYGARDRVRCPEHACDTGRPAGTTRNSRPLRNAPEDVTDYWISSRSSKLFTGPLSWNDSRCGEPFAFVSVCFLRQIRQGSDDSNACTADGPSSTGRAQHVKNVSPALAQAPRRKRVSRTYRNRWCRGWGSNPHGG
jgi:hypothetical protein